ncbi:MAG TPA: hypothetical protein VI565_04410, partial [Burkholderiales bacterium]|nr:hypothetical protein [Burkholderiales bacterium]
MIRFVGILALALCGVFAAFANDFPNAKRAATPLAMRFQWHTDRPPPACIGDCRAWVSATGPITAGTPG